LPLDDGAFAWIAAIAGITEKLVLVWHDTQLDAAATGIWFAGMDVALKSVKLLWQLTQSPLVGCTAST
jgi:hypothetical protein